MKNLNHISVFRKRISITEILGGTRLPEMPLGWRGVLLATATLCLLVMPTEAKSARGRMKTGLKQMKDKQFMAAATNFFAAAELAAGQDRSPAPAYLNNGNALYRASKWDAARERYLRALESGDVDLQAAVFFNIGNVDMKLAETALKEKKPKETIKHYDAAILSYEKSITVAPDYMDPKVNYEIAQNRKAALLNMVVELRGDLKQAWSMIRKHNYTNAAQFLQKRAAANETAFALDENLAKEYQDVLKRTMQIVKIVSEPEKGGER